MTTEDLVHVPLGPCTCPGTPHADGDYVALRPKLGMARALAIIKGLDTDDIAVTEMQLALGYTRFGIGIWNLSNGTGEPMPVDGEHLTKFAEEDPRAIVVAIRGDDLYSEEVMAPLRSMAAASSPTSATTGETSASTGTPPSTTRRKRSRRSSTSTTQTADTEPTTVSLDGGSSS